ncbi:MAG TPA: hypothetical protein VF715_15645 [Thermoleophilaceae bacterium]
MRRKAPAGTTRRPGLRLATGVVVLGAAIGVAGCVELKTVPGVSATCTQPTTMNDGFFADHGVFFRVSTQTDPANPRTTWVCYRIKTPNQPETAGRIDVNATTSTPKVDVTNDLDSRLCETTPGNGLWALTHPIEQGEVLDTPFYVDAYAAAPLTPTLTNARAWLCVEVGPVKQRVAVDVGDTNEPDVVHNNDSAPPPITDTTPPPAGKASTKCADSAYGTPREVVNAHLGGRDLFLYTAKPADNEAHVCARLSGPQSGGVHVGVKAAPSQIVDIQQSADTSPCTVDVVTVSNPPTSIKMTPVGQSPPSVCVNSTRFTLLSGPIPPFVTVELDS